MTIIAIRELRNFDQVFFIRRRLSVGSYRRQGPRWTTNASPLKSRPIFSTHDVARSQKPIIRAIGTGAVVQLSELGIMAFEALNVVHPKRGIEVVPVFIPIGFFEELDYLTLFRRLDRFALILRSYQVDHVIGKMGNFAADDRAHECKLIFIVAVGRAVFTDRTGTNELAARAAHVGAVVLFEQARSVGEPAFGVSEDEVFATALAGVDVDTRR